MPARPLVLVLPCHSLDDFPTHHVGEAATGLLASWTAAWHPLWIAANGEAPSWISVDDADVERLSGSIVLTPLAVEPHLPDDFQETVRAASADRLGHFDNRDSLTTALCDLQRSSLEDLKEDAVDDELVADFYSLGYWFLQIELLSRQVSYHSNLDEGLFRKKVASAAENAVKGDRKAAVELLTQCFGLLAEERDHYYPVDAYLIDLALVAPNATPQQLASVIAKELNRISPANLWMTGEKLEQLAAASAEVTKALATAVADRKVGLVGGEFGELPLTMLSAESLRRDWLRGIQTFESRLDARPTSFFRRRFGLAPRLASLLGSFGWQGAVHAVLDAGTFPSNGQPCSQWKEETSLGIPMLCRIPHDAALPETFLKLSVVMGRSMEIDYVATICLGRWAGTESDWFEDVRRSSKYGLRLGRATTCDDFFQSNHPDIHGETYALDQYRTPYLSQDVAANVKDPISRWQRRWQAVAALEAAQRIIAYAAAIADESVADCRDAWEAIEKVLQEIASVSDIERAQPQEFLLRASQLLARTVTKNSRELDPLSESVDQECDIAGWLMLNPYSHPIRSTWQLDSETLTIDAANADALHAFWMDDAESQAAVDISGNGFAWLPAEQKRLVSHRNGATGEDDGVPSAHVTDSMIDRSQSGYTILQNEFCAVHISETNGSIASLFDFRTRGNRLSQRLVRSGAQPIEMRCDRCDVTSDTPITGSVTTTGRLVAGNGDDDNKSEKEVQGTFEQTVSLTRGSRIARVQIRLNLLDPPSGKPWKDYVATRWAWPKAANDLSRAIQGVAYPSEGRKSESPWFFEVDDGNRRTAILSGGLPFHHRHDDQMLDTLLVVAGETTTEFELAIAVDLPQTHNQAESHWLPTIAVPCPAAPAQASGWLFHVGSKHVRITGCTPIWEETGKCIGMRVRLQEQSGGAGSFRLRGPKPIVTASKTDFVQSNSDELSVEDGVVSVRIEANEWTEVACRW